MRPSLLLLIALSLSGCVTRVNAPSVRPTYIASPSGEWQEVLLEMMPSTGIPRYTSADVTTSRAERVRNSQNTDRKGFLWRRRVTTDTVDLRWEFRGSDSWRAPVTARFVKTADATEPIVVSRRAEEDGEVRSRVHRGGFQSILRMQLDADSSNAWELTTSWSCDAERPGPWDAALVLRRGEQSFEVVAVTPRGPFNPQRPDPISLAPRASGWMVQANGVPFAVVQARGGGYFGMNDTRVWVPSGLSMAERRERIAVLMLVLVRDSAMPFSR